MGQYLKKFVTVDATPTLAVSLTPSAEDTVLFYTTNDVIKGKVGLRTWNGPENSFGVIKLNVTLFGRTKVTVPNLHPWASGRASKTKIHTFLCVNNSLNVGDLSNGIANANGHRLETKFNFVVPDKLLPNACDHNGNSRGLVIDSHIQLPPTFDATNSGKSFRWLDSVMSETVSISYGILVQVRVDVNGRCEDLQAELPICIMPMFDYSPLDRLPRYSLLSSTKTHEHFHNLRHGRLIVTVKQVPTLQITMSQDKTVLAAPSAVLLDIHFQPNDNSDAPPVVKSIQHRLHAYTYTSLTPFESEPDPEDFVDYSVGKMIYHNAVPLIQYGCETDDWENSGHGQQKLEHKEYTLSLQLPVDVAIDAMSCPSSLVPSFSTCLLSRNYMLEMRMTCRERNAIRINYNRHFTIKTPLMVRFVSHTSKLSSGQVK